MTQLVPGTLVQGLGGGLVAGPLVVGPRSVVGHGSKGAPGSQAPATAGVVQWSGSLGGLVKPVVVVSAAGMPSKQ